MNPLHHRHAKQPLPLPLPPLPPQAGGKTRVAGKRPSPAAAAEEEEEREEYRGTGRTARRTGGAVRGSAESTTVVGEPTLPRSLAEGFQGSTP